MTFTTQWPNLLRLAMVDDSGESLRATAKEMKVLFGDKNKNNQHLQLSRVVFRTKTEGLLFLNTKSHGLIYPNRYYKNFFAKILYHTEKGGNGATNLATLSRRDHNTSIEVIGTIL